MRLFVTSFVGVCLFLLLATHGVSQCEGQLFSAPARGSSGFGGEGPAQGMSRPQPRFERRNRRQVGFIGADRQDQTAFVGAAQAVAPSRAAVVRQPAVRRGGPRGQASAVNVPVRPAPSNSLYTPVLELDSVDIPDISVEGAAQGEEITERFGRLASFNDGVSAVQVTLQEGIAVLDGVVASDALKELAGKLVLFEPGVVQVQNQLQVSPERPARSLDSAPVR